MRKSTIVAVAILMSTYSFADTSATGFSKDSPQLKALGSAFKAETHTNTAPTLNSNDITMGYAGEDVAKKITVANITT